MSKILVLDIETRPAMAYVWRLFDENVSLDQLIDAGGVLCVGAKWFGEKGKFFYSEWEHGQEGMAEAVHKLMSEADAIVTYNGDRFDIPKLKGLFVELELEPLPPLTSIDIYKTVKKLGLVSNKLQFVGTFLKIGKKLKHAGFQLWVDVMNGDRKAQNIMRKYCLQDVVLTELTYKRLRPHIINHPYLGKTKGHQCGVCGSTHLQSRGYRRTKAFRIQRIQCQSCGSWSDGKREKVT